MAPSYMKESNKKIEYRVVVVPFFHGEEEIGTVVDSNGNKCKAAGILLVAADVLCAT